MTRMLPGCDAEGCDFGWRWCTPEYAADLYPLPELPDPTTVTEAEQATYATKVADAWERREAFAGAVFPCPNCRAEAFRRWYAGCWRPEHKATECELCTEALGAQAARSHDRAVARTTR